MAVVKGSNIGAFVRSIPRHIVSILIYGDDAGLVRDTARSIVSAVAGSTDDPFRVTRLSEQQISQDPAILADEFNALSLIGGRRAVWVTDAGTNFLKSIEPILEDPRSENVIVAESGVQPKSSRLRILFETTDVCAAIPHYAENEQDLGALIADEMRSGGLTIAADARELLIALLSGGRLDSRQQIAKLVTYCIGHKTVSLEDVRACCAEAGELSADDLLDAALDGDLEEADRHASRLLAGGMSGTRLLSAAAFNLTRLQRMRARVDRGDTVELVLRSARPPVFFDRQPSLSRQLHLWNSDALASLMSSFSGAILNCRENAALEDSIASRTFLSAARAAKALRSGR